MLEEIYREGRKVGYKPPSKDENGTGPVGKGTRSGSAGGKGEEGSTETTAGAVSGGGTGRPETPSADVRRLEESVAKSEGEPS